MYENEAAILGELIQERNLVAPEQFAEIEEEHQRTGKPLSRVIIDFGLLTEDQLLRAVADHLHYEYIDLADRDVPSDVVRSLPGSVARMYGAVPVALNGNLVTVAVLDPFNPSLVEELSFVLGKDVQLAVAPVNQIEEAIGRYYGEDSESMKEILTDMESQFAAATETDDGGKPQSTAAIEEMASQAPIVRSLAPPPPGSQIDPSAEEQAPVSRLSM